MLPDLEPTNPPGPARPNDRLGLLLALGGRLGVAVSTVLGATALLLTLLVFAPGDPIDLLPNAAEVRPQLEREWGLDQPAPVRWVRQLGRWMVLDLGTSYAYRPGAEVTRVIAVPVARTAALVGAASALVMVWGTALAFLTAGRRAPIRVAVQMASLAPGFLLAHGAVAVGNEAAWTAMGRGWIARPEWFALPDQASSVRTAIAIGVLALGSGALSEVHAEVEDALVRLRSSPWVDAARARGARTGPLVLRGLLAPLAATVANRATLLVGGAIVVEKLLLLHGAGAVLWEAAVLRDYDLALSIAVLAAVFVAGIRLLSDAVRIAVDPRLREVG